MKKSEQKKCYFYTRVSTEIQVDGYSLEAQYQELEKEAKHRGFVLSHHFSDEGKSGKNTKNREQFREMLNAIKENRDGVSYVFVFKLSRFGRNAADVLNSVQLMQDYGVNLLCVKDGIDSASASGKLMISVLSAVAEIERENIHEQTMAGRRQKARDGKWNGGFAPYGYKLVDGKLEIADDEVEIIKAIFNKFAEGDIGLGGVAKWLTQKGYTKKLRQNGTVSNFSAHFVKGVIDNPVYMGKIAFGRRKTEKIDGTRNEFHVVVNKDYNTYYEGIHEAIVSEKLWYQCQEKRKITGVKHEKVYSLEHQHVLSSILKCPVCGSGMYGNISRKKKKKPGPNGETEWYKDQFTYVCKHRKMIDGHKCSFKRQPNQDKINVEVFAIVKEFIRKNYLESQETLEKYASNEATIKIAEINSNSTLEEKKADIERLKKTYNQKEAAKNKFFDRMQSLDICDVNYDIKFDDLQKLQDKLYIEMQEIDKQIAELETSLNTSTEEAEMFDYAMKCFYEMMENGIENFPDGAKKDFFNQLIERVEIFEDDKEHGRWVKHIRFKIPIAYEDDGDEVLDYYPDDNSVDTVKHDETCVLLSREHIKKSVTIGYTPDGSYMNGLNKHATYKEINEYVQEKYGFRLHSAYIAQVKREMGIEMGENYNLSKSEDYEPKLVTPEKREAIIDALKHFNMID